MPTTGNKLFDTALWYCNQMQWSVIPCEPKGKKPLVRWEMYQTIRPQEKQIQRWWTEWPNANVAIITGKISGILVLDYDGEEGGLTLTNQYPELEPTAMAVSGNGGHYYFRYPDADNSPQRYQNFAKKVPGIDFRGDGGFIVAPPSIHQTGKMYEWKFDPYHQKLSDTPDWLISLIEKQGNGRSSDTAPPKDKISQGERNVHFASLAGSMRRRGMDQPAIIEALKEENKVKCDPLLSEFEIKNIAKSVCRYNPSDSYKAPELPVPVSMADIERKTVNWLWQPYIPYGFITALEGDPGEGKSFVSCAIATALSLGNGLPGGAEIETGNTILLTAEDHLGASVKGRLEDMQADMSCIYAIDEQFPLDQKGFAHIETMIRSFSTKLLVIDPIIAFLPATMNMNMANEVRQVLARLAHIAELYDCCVLIIRHLSKGQQSKAIYRGQGSIDFTAACRSVLLAGHSADDRFDKGVAHIKCNVGPIGNAIGYRIDRGAFTWTEHTTITSEQILGSEEDFSVVGEAKDFLIDLLQDGPVSSKKIMQQSKEVGITITSLRRAQKALGIKAQKEGMEGGWSWKLK